MGKSLRIAAWATAATLDRASVRLRMGALAGAFSLLAACSSQKGYEQAFAGSTALVGNSHSFAATPEQTFKSVKITLVQQGFAIEQANSTDGLIKALRTFEDPKNKKIAYLVTTSIDLTGAPSGEATIVTASASQQTVLHKDSEKYYHLLGLVPIPTGKDYQTIVRKEGNITDTAFYRDFFMAVAANMPKSPPVTVYLHQDPPPAPAAEPISAPAPAAPAAVEVPAPAAEPTGDAPATVVGTP